MDRLLCNIGELATLSSGDVLKPLVGTEMYDRDSLVSPPGQGILIEDGRVVRIDDSDALVDEFSDSGIQIIDVGGKAIIPGFVDSHTHLVWSGDRSNEMAMRQAGLTYHDIAQRGGGINKTVSSTRKASLDDLLSSALQRIEIAKSTGTTTLEAKSGYGLSLESELKLLDVIDRVSKNSSIQVLSTWLGAHDFPKGVSKDEYMQELISEQLPVVAENSLATWVDVFCEPGWYSIEQTEEIVNAAKELGLRSRLHVDEFVDGNGLSLAAQLGSDSGDHVGHSNDESRSLASKRGVLQTFLPGTPYVLGKDFDYPFEKCLEEEWAFGFATDFNPNCNTLSLPMVGSLVTHRMGLDPLAALVGVTRNPATSLCTNAEDIRGSIRIGGHADLNILFSPYVDGWCQTPGNSPIHMTITSSD